jgi:hypothetical protein
MFWLPVLFFDDLLFCLWAGERRIEASQGLPSAAFSLNYRQEGYY